MILGIIFPPTLFTNIMPIYLYACADCGERTEALQKLSDPPLTRCPTCGKDALQKQVTAAGFQLKGSGWYATDFRDGGKAAASVPASTVKAEPKTESKSESKSESATPASSTSAAASAPAP